MNFTAAADCAERDQLIAAEIAATDWLDVVARCMTHGGWPEKAAARGLGVNAQGETIKASVAIDFVELCPQGCNAYPRRFDETALAEVSIDRHTGEYSIDKRAAQRE